MPVQNSSNEIKLIRLYDAPLGTVWEAWTNPKQVAQWWGPRGFTLTTHSKDLKPGGIWHYTMHGPDGIDYPNWTLYHEVEKNSRLVYDHGGYKDKPPMFRVTVLFSEQQGKTKMDMTMTLATPEVAEATRKFIKKAGGEATWDRLAEYLGKLDGKEQFVINRSFDAPIDLMYRMWTDPNDFSKWIPPAGFDMKFIRAEIKAGGETLSCMSGPGGVKMYGKANYIELKSPYQLMYTQQFSDEDGNVSRHPMAPTWPETMLTIVRLSEEGPDKTRVTITWEPYGKNTQEELETFIKGRAGMTQGWTGSFDKLEGYLLENK